jgi:hypothetical protein
MPPVQERARFFLSALAPTIRKSHIWTGTRPGHRTRATAHPHPRRWSRAIACICFEVSDSEVTTGLDREPNPEGRPAAAAGWRRRPAWLSLRRRHGGGASERPRAPATRRAPPPMAAGACRSRPRSRPAQRQRESRRAIVLADHELIGEDQAPAGPPARPGPWPTGEVSDRTGQQGSGHGSGHGGHCGGYLTQACSPVSGSGAKRGDQRSRAKAAEAARHKTISVASEVASATAVSSGAAVPGNSLRDRRPLVIYSSTLQPAG